MGNAVPVSTQEYKWIPVNCQGILMKCWGWPCNGLPSYGGGGEGSNTRSSFMAQKPGWAPAWWVTGLECSTFYLQVTPSDFPESLPVVKMKFSAYEVNTVLFAWHIFNKKGSFDFSHMVSHYNIPVSVTLRFEPMVQKVVYANRD